MLPPLLGPGTCRERAREKFSRDPALPPRRRHCNGHSNGRSRRDIAVHLRPLSLALSLCLSFSTVVCKRTCVPRLVQEGMAGNVNVDILVVVVVVVLLLLLWMLLWL